MTLRSRLMVIGMPLVVLPLAASLVLFSAKMAEMDQVSRYRILQGQLSLVQQHVEAAWGVLSKVGFEDNEFYQKTVSRTIESHLAALSGPGEAALVIDRTGTVLLGPPEWKGRPIGQGDSLAVLFERSEGQTLVSVPFGANTSYLVCFRRFTPWNWVMVTVADQSLVWDKVVQGLYLSAGTSLFFLLLAAAGFWFFARQASRPLVELQTLARQMGGGRVDLRAEGGDLDETISLALEWNAMVDRVQELTSDLELRVANRTRDLAGALEQTRTMQSQLILSEKMASLGQLVAGIAHELNTPLGAIASAQRTLDEVLVARWTPLLETLASLSVVQRGHVGVWLERSGTSPTLADTVTRRRVRKELTRRLLAAGVVDPAETADRFVEVGLVDWTEAELGLLAGSEGQRLVNLLADLALVRISSRLISVATGKADRVIGALRIYSRHDPSREATVVSLAESLDTVLPLFQNRLKSGIEVVRDLPADLTVLADGDRLGQLWTNLISNALAAMESQGRLELTAQARDGWVVVWVSDTGSGIPAELQGRIFTPFFTTKKAGEGSGLGLSICQTIVQEAGGTITFHSVPGHTVFEVRFPCP